MSRILWQVRKWAGVLLSFVGPWRSRFRLAVNERSVWYENRRLAEQYAALREEHAELLDHLDLIGPELDRRAVATLIYESRHRLAEIDGMFWWKGVRS